MCVEDVVAAWAAAGDKIDQVVDLDHPGNYILSNPSSAYSSLTDALLSSTFTWNYTSHSLAYKKVSKRILPVSTVMPEYAKIHRRFPEDPLLTLPALSPHPPEFTPGDRLTQERLDDLGIFKNSFLWPEEQRLAAQVLKVNEMGLAWNEMEKGRFRDEYFSPVVFPVIPHTPWCKKNLPIPPGIRDKVVDLIKQKVAAGVYEPSTSSYRHQWFCVAKKDGSVRIVHNLGPLNAVTVKDAGQPPLVDQYADQCSAHSVYTGLDLFVGYDHRTTDPISRPYTSFDTPLGTHQLTVLPQGWTGSLPIFHNDVAFILQDEVEIAPNFSDDISVLGPKTRYELDEGGYEVIEENKGVRRFIWEHLTDVNRVLHRLKHAGATVSAKKLFLCRPELVVVGQLSTYEGRVPDKSTVIKIKTWPPCEDISEVRGFLGTAGTVRIWIQDFAEISRPLVDLTKKDTDFEWLELQQASMDQLKDAVISCPAIRPIDYKSGLGVILAVDLSFKACGYILLQLDTQNRRRPARFGSISWNERESRYSQAKIELYGLFRALHAVRIFIIGVLNLTVEVDAKYIKGMINNPDMHPNAAMNRWIAAILLYDFKLVHVPGKKFKGPDGLSRRRKTVDEGDTDDDGEDWVDEILSAGVWVAAGIEDAKGGGVLKVEVTEMGTVTSLAVTSENPKVGEGVADEFDIPQNETAVKRDEDLLAIKTYLQSLKQPTSLNGKALQQFVKRASRFFVRGDRLWRRESTGRHQIVIFGKDRLRLLNEAHDKLGHKGFYPTRRNIADRFWWPTLDDDIHWFLKTCHPCQTRSVEKVLIPPTVSIPATLFRKAHIDSMYMPVASGYKYIVHARCSLSGWPEWRKLRKETARTLGSFIFEEILCRWGGLQEIVTDNGTPFVAALDWLAEKYHIHHIRISPYNSRSNGIIESPHRPVRDALVKACEGDITKWPEHAPYIFWAERITTRKSTGFSPYYAAHGVEPLLPFDITEATFLLPDIVSKLSDSDLLALRALQLEKRESDLALIHDRVLRSRFASIKDFERRFTNIIHDYAFQPGDLVLVLNKKIEAEAGRKCKPRYFGPMVVAQRLRSGAYRLAEVTGTISRLKFAAFRLIPYYARSTKQLEVTEFIDPADLAGISDEDEA